jgi:hypothetical protein
MHMHDLVRHLTHSSETLSSAQETLRLMISTYETIVSTSGLETLSSANIKAELEQQASLLNCLQLRSQSLESRLQNELNLVCFIPHPRSKERTVTDGKVGLQSNSTVRLPCRNRGPQTKYQSCKRQYSHDDNLHSRSGLFTWDFHLCMLPLFLLIPFHFDHSLQKHSQLTNDSHYSLQLSSIFRLPQTRHRNNESCRRNSGSTGRSLFPSHYLQLCVGLCGRDLE